MVKQEEAKKAIEEAKTFLEKNVDTIDKARDVLEKCIIKSFADEQNEAWAQFSDGQTKRFLAIESEAFRDWIRVQLNTFTGKPREAWVEQLTKLFASKGRRNDQQRLHLRQANINGLWFIQTRPDQALKIHEGKIELTDSPTIFRTFPHQQELKFDLNAEISDIDLINKYVNFASLHDRELFKTILPVYFVPGISKPILLARGPPGAAKSSMCRFIKLTVDPTTTMHNGIVFPKNDGDWFVNCRQNAVIFMDNISHLTKDQQDECCRATTGKTIEKRKLYTDSDTVSADTKSILIINAIDLTDLNSDFLDRALIWDLERIKDEQRLTEEELNRHLSKDLPKIRGAILKILTGAQKLFERTTAPDMRLKDFAQWSAACAQARGQELTEFIKQLQIKTELQKDESIAQSPLAAPIEKFMKDKPLWEGTATELLKALTEQEHGKIVGQGVDEKIVVSYTPKDWFKDPRAMGKELSRIGFLMERLGLHCSSTRGAKGTRRLIIQNYADFHATHATRQVLSSTKQGGKVQETRCHLMPLMPPDTGQEVARGMKVAREGESHATRYTSSEADKTQSENKVTKVTRDYEELIVEEEIVH